MKTWHYIIKIPVTCLVVVIFVNFSTLCNTAYAQSEVHEVLDKALLAYFNADFDEGISNISKLIDRESIESKDRAAVYSLLSLLYYAKGEKYLQRSYDYLNMIAEIGPCTIPLPHEFWPQRIRDQWWAVTRPYQPLVCSYSDEPTKMNTIAIMEFDNYSVQKYQDELGFLCKGLSDFFQTDLAMISDLTVLERDKINYITEEVTRGQSGLIDKATAVKIGKIIGAHIMVFGTLTQLDGRNAKMLVRAVNVETSELITSAEREGKPEYFNMQKELVLELAQKLDLTLNEDAKTKIKESAAESDDAAFLYSQGLYYMDKYDYTKAYEYFKQAYELDNSFTLAKQKMDLYYPLVTVASGSG
jgi:TolB-like protein